jgi:hypothetical protein
MRNKVVNLAGAVLAIGPAFMAIFLARAVV